MIENIGQNIRNTKEEYAKEKQNRLNSCEVVCAF